MLFHLKDCHFSKRIFYALVSALVCLSLHFLSGFFSNVPFTSFHFSLISIFLASISFYLILPSSHQSVASLS